MIKKIVNSILIFVAVSLYTLILGAAYCSGKEINDYTAFTLILITPILYLIMLYTSGKFDNYINNTLEPLLQKLLKWFNRRNLMLLIVLISFTGCRTYIDEDEAIIVSAHKTTHSKTYRYYYQLNSANGKYIFYSNQEFQVGTPTWYKSASNFYIHNNGVQSPSLGTTFEEIDIVDWIYWMKL